MKEFIEILDNVWMNQVLGNHIVSFVYRIVTVVLFYHWTLDKLSKRNISFLKSSVFILIAMIAIRSLIYFLQYPYRASTVRIWDFYRYLDDVLKLIIVFAVYTMLSMYLLKKERPINNQLRAFIVLICFGLYFSVNISVMKSYRKASFDLWHLLELFLLSGIATSLEIVIRRIFRKQQNKEYESKMENLVLKERVIKAQYDLLHSKVNPHFLYNSLNSIAGLALVDGDKTKEMALSLSRFFKYSINREPENIISVSEEIEMLTTYLEIERIRFEDRLQYSILVAPETKNIKIPKFILQPLVENSIKYGQSPFDYSINITVDVKKDKDELIISVKDKGKPYDEDIEPGYGIKSVSDKLDLFCPGKYEISLTNVPEKAINITIEM